MLTLYSYYRSSAAYRVRIALALKQLPYEVVPVHLLRGGGEQLRECFAARNPARLVPVLDTEHGALTQSLAILEYLDELQPLPPLLPADPFRRAQVRSLALSIACDLHPLNNLRVLRYLERPLGVDAELRAAWSRHWMEQGLAVAEQWLQNHDDGGPCCVGDTPTLADCCLVPQAYNATRLRLSLSSWPRVGRVYQHCIGLPAFIRAAPASQLDAEINGV